MSTALQMKPMHAQSAPFTQSDDTVTRIEPVHRSGILISLHPDHVRVPAPEEDYLRATRMEQAYRVFTRHMTVRPTLWTQCIDRIPGGPAARARQVLTDYRSLDREYALDAYEQVVEAASQQDTGRLLRVIANVRINPNFLREIMESWDEAAHRGEWGDGSTFSKDDAMWHANLGAWQQRWRLRVNQFVQGYFWLAYKEAKHFPADREEVASRYQEAMLALLHAAERFEPGRAPFPTVAIAWIRNRLRHKRNQERSLLKIGRPQSPAPTSQSESDEKSDNSPDMGIPIRVAEMDEARVVDPQGQSGEFTLEQASVLNRVFALSREMLSDRERWVLEMLFGLSGTQPATLRHVAEQLGVSSVRVHQIKSRAIDKMKQQLREEGAL